MLPLQDDLPHEQDEESARKVGLLQIELESVKAVEQIQMLQQVGDMLLLLHAQTVLACYKKFCTVSRAALQHELA